jgi:hypothetical protein
LQELITHIMAVCFYKWPINSEFTETCDFRESTWKKKAEEELNT